MSERERRGERGDGGDRQIDISYTGVRERERER